MQTQIQVVPYENHQRFQDGATSPIQFFEAVSPQNGLSHEERTSDVARRETGAHPTNHALRNIEVRARRPPPPDIAGERSAYWWEKLLVEKQERIQLITYSEISRRAGRAGPAPRGADAAAGPAEWLGHGVRNIEARARRQGLGQGAGAWRHVAGGQARRVAATG
jgi:hypothetical protein